MNTFLACAFCLYAGGVMGFLYAIEVIKKTGYNPKFGLYDSIRWLMDLGMDVKNRKQCADIAGQEVGGIRVIEPVSVTLIKSPCDLREIEVKRTKEREMAEERKADKRVKKYTQILSENFNRWVTSTGGEIPLKDIAQSITSDLYPQLFCSTNAYNDILLQLIKESAVTVVREVNMAGGWDCIVPAQVSVDMKVVLTPTKQVTAK